MTHKQYQNVSFKELLLYLQNNPNRTRELESIEIHDIKPDTSLEKIGLLRRNFFMLHRLIKLLHLS